MTTIALSNGVNHISKAYVQRARGALYADSIQNKQHFLRNNGVIPLASSYAVRALIQTKQSGQATSLRLQATQALHNVNSVLAFAERKLQMITEQQHNISLGNGVDPQLAAEFNSLTDLQNQVILSTKLGSKRLLAKAEDNAASNKQFPCLVEGADIKVEMPMLDMSLLYVNSRTVRQAFDDLTFFDQEVLQQIANAADAVDGDIAKIKAALNVIIDIIAVIDDPLEATEQGVKDTIIEALDMFWSSSLYNTINGGVVIDLDSLEASILHELTKDLSVFQRSKYNEILDLVRTSAEEGEDFNIVKDGVMAQLNAINTTLTVFTASITAYGVALNVDPAAQYSYLVPMLEYVQQVVTIYRLNDSSDSIIDIPLNSPIWIHRAEEGDGDEEAGHFDFRYVTVDHVARILGHSIASFDGVIAVEDFAGRKVGTATSIDSVERVQVAILAEQEVIHQLAQGKKEIADLVANFEGRILRFAELKASLAELIQVMTEIDPLKLEQNIKEAQSREYAIAYVIGRQFKDHDHLIVTLNK